MKQLSEVALAHVRMLNGIIQAKQLELDAMQLGLQTFIERESGVNLRKDTWHLDIQTGKLTREGTHATKKQ